MAAHRAVLSNANKVEDWLPRNFPETTQLEWFRNNFGGQTFVALSWPGCQLGGNPDDPNAFPDDPRIERLANILVPGSGNLALEDSASDSAEAIAMGAAEPAQDAVLPESYRGMFKSVITGRRLINQMTAPPSSLPYEAAKARLKGSMIGPDGQQTCVIVFLSNDPDVTFEEVLGHGQARGPAKKPPGAIWHALWAAGIDPETVRMGGPPVDNVAIDEEGQRTLAQLAGLSMVLTVFLAYASLRSLRLTAMVLLTGVTSGAGALAVVWLSGQNVDAILISMPPLIYVLAVSGAIHIINYYRDALHTHGWEAAPGVAIAHAWKPALLCNTTTALGLASLVVSDLVPIRKFGLFSAIGVVLSLFFMFTLLPAMLRLWPLSRHEAKSAGPATGHGPATADEDLSAENPLAYAFGRFIVRFHWLVAIGCVAAIVTIGYGVVYVGTSIDLMRLFDSDARILCDYRWLESNLGRLVPMEIVLRFDRDVVEPPGDSERHGGTQRLSLIDRMGLVAQVHAAVARKFGASGDNIIGPPMSAISFVPQLPTAGQGMSNLVKRKAVNSQLNQSYAKFQQSGYLRLDSDTNDELWRISIRVGAFQDVDYGHFAHDVQNIAQPVVDAYNKQCWADGAPHVDAVYTGVVPIVYKAQRSLLNSLIESTFWSFFTITPIIIFVCGGFLPGIVAMLPNVLPVLAVFGAMGWMGMNVDIGSMMSASIALGVAVDDTIHYLTWYRSELSRLHNRHLAILGAYRRCAAPTLQATLVNGLGLSVFALSSFSPTRQFGYLMLAILLAGVVAELVMLPALLAGPLGRVFYVRALTEESAPAPVPSPHFEKPQPEVALIRMRDGRRSQEAA